MSRALRRSLLCRWGRVGGRERDWSWGEGGGGARPLGVLRVSVLRFSIEAARAGWSCARSRGACRALCLRLFRPLRGVFARVSSSSGLLLRDRAQGAEDVAEPPRRIDVSQEGAERSVGVEEALYCAVGSPQGRKVHGSVEGISAAFDEEVIYRFRRLPACGASGREGFPYARQVSLEGDMTRSELHE